jgi:radical SAM superfamily enzyme
VKSAGEKAKKMRKNRRRKKPGKACTVKTALDTPQSEALAARRFKPPLPAGDNGESFLPGQDRKPLIIPIFIMNRGCPQHCIFCNEKIAAGNFPPEVTQNYFAAEVASYLRWNKDKMRRVEIAFYGGSFTGLPPDDQKRLLSWADIYIQKGQVESIRISTRPDYINDEQLIFLHRNGVRTIEIGAQSFNDQVLHNIGRGHDARATETAIQLLKARGFKTGLHLMAGLPGDTRESFLSTLQRTVELQPDTARIHPVLVFKDTPLADEFLCGRYHPLTLEEAVDWCRLAWETLAPAGISIIRFGLQMTPEMSQEGAVLAGPLHPSFGSLVYSAVFYSAILKLLGDVPEHTRTLRFQVAQRDLSHFRGFGNKNIEAIKRLYPDAQIVIDSVREGLPGHLSLNTGAGEFFSFNIPGIQ